MYDSETKLNYNYHRSYDPATGSYTTSDPIGLAGGWNTYAYVNGDPVNLVDPDGLNPLKKICDFIPACKAAAAAALKKITDACKKVLGKADDAPKSPPNPYGKKGGPQHQDKIKERINDLKNEGHEHVGGGNLPEERIPTPGGEKSYRSPDITTRAPDGSTYRENVGRTNANGNPIPRETRALDDIESATGQRPGYTPYDR